MPIQPAAVDLLAALAPIASRWGRWYVFGAQAVIVYGVPRLSADVDVTLALEPEAQTRFIADLRAAGFDLRAPGLEFIQRTGVMPFVHQPTGMPLDVVLAGSGLEEAFLSRATPKDIGGVVVPFIAVGDLVVAKVLAGRPKDLEDARALWRLHGDTLDGSRIRATLALIEQALGRSDLVPAFDALSR